MMRKKLNDIFPEWLDGNGIFSAIGNVAAYSPPWVTQISNAALDVEYHGNNSGEKYISALAEKMLADGELSSQNKARIAAIIVGLYSRKWSKLWATLIASYNPLENYDSTETENIEAHDTGTVIDNNVMNYGSTETRNASNTALQSQSVFGFNSSNGVPSDSSTGSNTGTDTNAKTGADTENGTRTDNLTHTTSREFRRHGNIGVTTSQQMLQSERDLWLWSFFEVVFSDIDDVIASPIY